MADVSINLFTVLLAALSLLAHAELRTVLIRVGDDLNLDTNLKGRANDVSVMADVLTARVVPAQKIAVFTSDPTEQPEGLATTAPTKTEILSALQCMENRVQPDDPLGF